MLRGFWTGARCLILALLLAGVANSLALPTQEQQPESSAEVDDSNQVSWPSIFWALLAIAINSMSQPSIMDTDVAPSNPIFPSHSSPIICVMDAIDVTLDLILHLLLGHNIQDAASRVNWRRARARLGENIESVEEAPFEKYPMGTALVFLGALSQAIKIFGCHGIVWAKMLAGMYLSSYVVLTLMVFLPSRDWRNTPPPAKISSQTSAFTPKPEENLSWIFEPFAQCVYFAWVFVQIACTTHLDKQMEDALPKVLSIVVQVILGAVLIWSSSAVVLIGVLVPFFGIIKVILFTVEGREAINSRKRLVSFGAAFVYVVGVGGACPIALPCVLRVFASDGSDVEGLLFATLILVIVLVLRGFWSRLMMGWVWVCDRMSLQRMKPETKRMPELLLFATMNLVVLILYCRLGYDPRGSFKPRWTEKLG